MKIQHRATAVLVTICTVLAACSGVTKTDASGRSPAADEQALGPPRVGLAAERTVELTPIAADGTPVGAPIKVQFTAVRADEVAALAHRPGSNK